MPKLAGGVFVALNAYYLQEEATRSIRRGELESAVLEEVFAKVRAMGVEVVRTNAFNDDPAKAGDSAMQVARLTYDETALRGMDLVLARAQAHGVRLVLALGNYWNAYGGARQYVAWAGLPNPSEGDARFFTESSVAQHYAEHVRRLLSRRSSVDGLTYGAHPAVLAWELLNEPRGRGLAADGSQLRAWVDELGGVVKSVAPAALVSTGEEGFDANPSGYDARFWSSSGASMFPEGASYRLDSASPVVDVASVHWYPEAWGVKEAAIARAGANWIVEHAAIARSLGKPLILGEFALRNDGAFVLDERRALYRGWFSCARSSGVAAAPWLFAYDARPDSWDPHTFYFRDATQPTDPVNRYADLVVAASR